MQKLPDRVPFFTHFPPYHPISPHFSFLLEHFHTFSMMYLQQFPIAPPHSPPISPHFSPFPPISLIFPWLAGYSDTPDMDTF